MGNQLSLMTMINSDHIGFRKFVTGATAKLMSWIENKTRKNLMEVLNSYGIINTYSTKEGMV